MHITLQHYYAYDFSTPTLGSNSTATSGPSVVELITFAALSWGIVSFAILAAIIMYFTAKYGDYGKQSAI